MPTRLWPITAASSGPWVCSSGGLDLVSARETNSRRVRRRQWLELVPLGGVGPVGARGCLEGRRTVDELVVLCGLRGQVSCELSSQGSW